MKLSKRLQTIADLILPGAKIADIGTDHGYLPVYLALNNQTKRIIASDISAGSLQSAKRSAEKYNVLEKITLIHAPGLESIAETDADTIVISGVGGETIIEILRDAPWTKNGKRLILQPQTKIRKLYDFLSENGYKVREERHTCDRGRTYTVILAQGGSQSMTNVADIYDFLNSIAPIEMKMDFDNVGFLVGKKQARVSKILVALDVTDDVITESVELDADLIVSHHPLFFSLKSITDDDLTGRKIIRMLVSGLSAICMHTNLDAVRGGVNDALAKAAGIADDEQAELLPAIFEMPTGEAVSFGRVGHLKSPCTMDEYLAMLKRSLKTEGLRYYDAGRDVYKVAVVGGSGGDELQQAVSECCDTFVTSDIKYHTFLDAKELGINLIDGDHFCTENTITEVLVDKLNKAFPDVQAVASKRHTQTVRFY